MPAGNTTSKGMNVETYLKGLSADNTTPMLAHYLQSASTPLERRANNLPVPSRGESIKKMKEIVKDLTGALGGDDKSVDCSKGRKV